MVGLKLYSTDILIATMDCTGGVTMYWSTGVLVWGIGQTKLSNNDKTSTTASRLSYKYPHLYYVSLIPVIWRTVMSVKLDSLPTL